MDLYVFFILYISAVHVSGAICTHHQEQKLQSTAIGMRNLWKAEFIYNIITQHRMILYITCTFHGLRIPMVVLCSLCS
jgi:hypothetical protein